MIKSSAFILLIGCLTISNGQQSSLTCNFDASSNSLCGLIQSTDDNFDWTRWSLETPTGLSGPSSGYTSRNSPVSVQQSDYYLYIETSEKNAHAFAKLLTPVFIAGRYYFQLFYHAYGSTIGSLAIGVEYDYISSESQYFTTKSEYLWYHTGHKNGSRNEWLSAAFYVSVPRNFRFFIEGYRSTQAFGDIAIDLLTISRQGNALTSTRPAESFGLPMFCDFAVGTCGIDLKYWKSTGNANWTRLMGPTSSIDTGPPADVSGDSYYMYLETSNRLTYQVAYAITPLFYATCGCVDIEFFWHGYGSTLGTLTVFAENSRTPLWQTAVTSINAWQRANIKIENHFEPLRLVFAAQVGAGVRGDYAVDNIRVSACSFCGTTTTPSTTPTTTITTSTVAPTVPTTSTAVPPTTPTTTTPTTTKTTTTTALPLTYGQFYCEVNDDCSFTNVNQDDPQWLRVTTSGSLADHSTGTGHFFELKNNLQSKRRKRQVASTTGTMYRTVSARSRTGCHKLDFYYFATGNSGTFSTSIVTNGLVEIQTWGLSLSTTSWTHQVIYFYYRESFMLQFYGKFVVAGDSSYGVDDIRLSEVQCSQIPFYQGTTPLNGRQGKIHSPNYPHTYPANTNHKWTILVDEGMYIQYNFSSMNVETCCDLVIAKDPLANSELNIGSVLQDGDLSRRFLTSGNQLEITFTSDSQRENTGWEMSWKSFPVLRTSPPVISFGLLNCTFDSGLCGLTNANIRPDVWTRIANATPNINTGPDGNRLSNGGYYLYVNTKEQTASNAVVLRTAPTFSTTGCIGVNFWYFGFGNALGTFSVQYTNNQTGTQHTLWQHSGLSTPQWKEVSLFIQESVPVTITFHAKRRLDGGASDYALDDIVISETPCPSESTTPLPANGGQTNIAGSLSGILISPNYPANYIPSWTHTYDITVASGKDVQFIIEDFSTESGDTLVIEDGNTPRFVLATITGIELNLPRNIYSLTSNARLTFTTDSTLESKGWRIRWVEHVPSLQNAPEQQAAVGDEFEKQSTWVYVVFGLTMVFAVVLLIIIIIWFKRKYKKNRVDDNEPESKGKDIPLKDNVDSGKLNGVHGAYRDYRVAASPTPMYTSESEAYLSPVTAAVDYFPQRYYENKPPPARHVRNGRKKKRVRKLDETGQPIAEDPNASHNHSIQNGHHSIQNGHHRPKPKTVSQELRQTSDLTPRRSGSRMSQRSRDAIISIPGSGDGRTHTPRGIAL